MSIPTPTSIPSLPSGSILTPTLPAETGADAPASGGTPIYPPPNNVPATLSTGLAVAAVLGAGNSISFTCIPLPLIDEKCPQWLDQCYFYIPLLIVASSCSCLFFVTTNARFATHALCPLPPVLFLLLIIGFWRVSQRGSICPLLTSRLRTEERERRIVLADFMARGTGAQYRSRRRRSISSFDHGSSFSPSSASLPSHSHTPTSQSPPSPILPLWSLQSLPPTLPPPPSLPPQLAAGTSEDPDSETSTVPLPQYTPPPPLPPYALPSPPPPTYSRPPRSANLPANTDPALTLASDPPARSLMLPPSPSLPQQLPQVD